MRTEWLGTRTAAEFLAADARRLRAAEPSAAAAVLSDRSVSIGVRCELSPPLLRELADRGWPVLRRSTGGTALLHGPGDLLWSLVLPRADPRVGRGFVRAYGRLGAPLVEALRPEAVPAHWGPAAPLSPVFCLLGAAGETLRVGERVVGGAAQHLTARALLHHGAVHRAADRPTISRLFGIPVADLEARLGAVGEIAPTYDGERVGRRWLSAWAEAGP